MSFLLRFDIWRRPGWILEAGICSFSYKYQERSGIPSVCAGRSACPRTGCTQLLSSSQIHKQDGSLCTAWPHMRRTCELTLRGGHHFARKRTTAWLTKNVPARHCRNGKSSCWKICWRRQSLGDCEVLQTLFQDTNPLIFQLKNFFSRVLPSPVKLNGCLSDRQRHTD